MGQKTHPIGFRLGIIRYWNSRWFAPDREFADLIHEDMMVKKYINNRLDNAGIANVFISRAPRKVNVDIHTSRPGIVIGRKGSEVDKLREELQLLTSKDIVLNIVEVRKPELNAKLVADNISRQLVERVAFRRAMKRALSSSMKMGAEGIKIQCGGRLGGAEIARSETYKQGRIPLHTLRADIDYATSTAFTTYGTIGIKVWICLGLKLQCGLGEKETEGEIDSRDSQASRTRRGRSDQRDRDGGARKRPRGRVRRGPGGGEGDRPRGRRPEGVPAATDAPRPKARPADPRAAGPKSAGSKPADSSGAPKNKPKAE